MMIGTIFHHHRSVLWIIKSMKARKTSRAISLSERANFGHWNALCQSYFLYTHGIKNNNLSTTILRIKIYYKNDKIKLGPGELSNHIKLIIYFIYLYIFKSETKIKSTKTKKQDQNQD